VRLIDGMIGLKTHPASLIIYLIAKKMIRGIEFANEKWVDGLLQSDLQWHPPSNSSLSPSICHLSCLARLWENWFRRMRLMGNETPS
jgi:hypothetical protein